MGNLGEMGETVGGELVTDDLRNRIGAALQALGVAGYRDTTDARTRPQWRVSFASHGKMKGETRYLQVFVPVDADLVQVNCTVEAPALDTMPATQIQNSMEGIAGEYVPEGQQWEKILADLGVDPRDVDGWDASVAPHSGINHRMVLARITIPLADLSNRSLELATRIGYRLAQDARSAVTARWKASRKAK